MTGLSPQIITETLYALAVKPTAGQQPWIPTEVHIITTQEGAEHAIELLHPSTGWFHRLCEEYNLTGISFDQNNIHVLQDPGGQPLTDIREIDDNENAADQITEIVRELTEDDDSTLHVSIAGGRKTMGFYLGYALSLYGRPQDEMSHVLVSPPFESLRDFFFPIDDGELIRAHENGKPLQRKDAVVTLASIPFVRMRSGLPEELRNGKSSFSETVEAVQRGLGIRDVRRFYPACVDCWWPQDHGFLSRLCLISLWTTAG